MNIRKIRSKDQAADAKCPVGKVIIDTQGGVEDIIALIYAIQSAQNRGIEIVGITCTNGRRTVEQAATDAQIANVVTKFKIPIFKGSSQSMMMNKNFPECINLSNEFSALNSLIQKSDAQSSQNFQNKTAARFIVEQVRKHKSDLGIICLGPGTNVAIASHLDMSVRQSPIVSISGGQYSAVGNVKGKKSQEGNFSYDPHSAHLIIKTFRQESDQPSIFLTPIEQILTFNFDDILNCLKSSESHSSLFGELVELWKTQEKEYTLNGSLLNVANYFAPNTVQNYYEVYSEVCLDGAEINGLLAIDWLRMDIKEGERKENAKIVYSLRQNELKEEILTAFKNL